MATRTLRLILNGKKSDQPGIRDAVDAVRRLGHSVDVRVTWEAGDAPRYAAEALRDDVDVIVAAGGDGTVNEVANGILGVTQSPQTAMAVVPMGSANDFARGCTVPVGDIAGALRFAAEGEPVSIDAARINDRYFLNAVIAGFGAEVTFKTSDAMKKRMAGAAYALTGVLTALKRTVYTSHVRTPSGEREGEAVFAALANGVQAGGFTVAPRARLNDGLLDIMSVPDFPLAQLGRVLQDIQNLETSEPEIIRYEQIEWLEVEADRDIPASPDGEELHLKQFRLDVMKQCLPFVLPDTAPLIR